MKFAFHLALGKSTLLFGCELNSECLREAKMSRQLCVVDIGIAIRDRTFVIMYASSWLRRGAILLLCVDDLPPHQLLILYRYARMAKEDAQKLDGGVERS